MNDLPVPAGPQHRELTKEEREKLVAKSFRLERRIKANVAKENAAWWALAESLYELHQERGWEVLGYETLAEFLAQPEIGMSESTFHRGVRTWRDLHVTRQLPKKELREIPPSNAREILPAVMSGKVEPEAALSDAKTLSFRDVVEKYSPAKVREHGQSPDGSTPLNAGDEPIRVRCPTCGNWTTEGEMATAAARQQAKAAAQEAAK